MQFACSLAALLLSLYFSPATAHSQDNRNADYLGDLQLQAQQKKLADARIWHLLLKYNKDLFGGFTSEADGMDFFNSPQGKTNPESELQATLASFFMPLSSVAEGKEHPQ